MRDAGNFFFAGARIFFQSLEAAIFLFSRVARIPEGSLVLPAICTEERITLGAELVRRTPAASYEPRVSLCLRTSPPSVQAVTTAGITVAVGTHAFCLVGRAQAG